MVKAIYLAGVLGLDQPLSGGLEVSQAVLEVVLPPGVGPLLPVLPATPHVGDGHDAEVLNIQFQFSARPSSWF